MKIVLQKFIADSGYCSRRQAEKLIRGGAVKVNGKIASVGERADENDTVLLRGERIGRVKPEKIYIKLNKPLGYTCTSRKFENEKNVFDLVKVQERLFVVGRLDKNSRGLVLLTNDGALAQKLTHPRYEINKNYLVKIAETKGKLTDQDIAVVSRRLKNGLDIGEGDGLSQVKEVQYLQNNLFVLTLNEGKKRQIRRMFKALGLDILDLERVELGGLKLGNLSLGQWAYLTPTEIIKLKSN
jgi:pseudouridine synthase